MKQIDYYIANTLKTVKKYNKYVMDVFSGNGPYSSKYRFIDRKKNKKKLLYVLSGYKPYLWNNVFDRLSKFVKDDIDVCVVSSGKYSEELASVCANNDWSYLSTTRNNICVITNIVIRLFNKAELIYKMDEDIYLTEGCFEKMETMLIRVEKEGYSVGFVGPVVPINPFCMYRFIKRHGDLQEAEKIVGKRIDKCGFDEQVMRSNCGIDRYIWTISKNIDDLASVYYDEEGYDLCYARYYIGFVLFRRTLIEEMGPFKVFAGKGSGSEGDEGQLISYCILNSKVMAVARNTLVGHFSMGGAERSVLEYKEKHPEVFELIERT